MSPAAFVGFAAVFVLVAWSASAVLALLIVVARPALRRRGAATERKAAAFAVVAPSLIGVAVLVALLWGQTAGDHCEEHHHHAHLCVAHAGAWLDQSWAVVLVGVASATVLLRLVLVGGALLRTRHAVLRLRRVSQAMAHPGLRIVTSPLSFCFVAGLRRPEVFVSSAAWDALEPDQRQAVLAHELAHVRNGDLWRRAVLDLLGVLAAPLVAARLRSIWSSASERLADARAAESVGCLAVASAMVQMCRAGRVDQPLPGFTATGEALGDRVRAILEVEPTGERSASRLAVVMLLSTVMIVAMVLAFADPLHHVLETLLG